MIHVLHTQTRIYIIFKHVGSLSANRHQTIEIMMKSAL
ncbi:MAG: hypothetical protein BWY08_01332 [Bacteroidetes bacterium ADurb.Bin174]|nr:MAG: hypothetical protein BWY08_01332 [Bacteroidetes bacterium ADurb.Bin174]